jgi:hypothetical protein
LPEDILLNLKGVTKQIINGVEVVKAWL